jgi:hypothetical protein
MQLKHHNVDLKGVLAQITGLYDDLENLVGEAFNSSIFESVHGVLYPNWKHTTKEAVKRSVIV